MVKLTKKDIAKGRCQLDIKNGALIINGIEYIPKGPKNEVAEKFNGMKYVICRTYSAGVFAGYLESRNGQEVVMRNARRLWYWDGAASLSHTFRTQTFRAQKIMK